MLLKVPFKLVTWLLRMQGWGGVKVGQWWHMPLLPTLGKQRQAMSSRPARTVTQTSPVLKNLKIMGVSHKGRALSYERERGWNSMNWSDTVLFPTLAEWWSWCLLPQTPIFF